MGPAKRWLHDKCSTLFLMILVVSRGRFGYLVFWGGGFGDLGGFERWFW